MEEAARRYDARIVAILASLPEHLVYPEEEKEIPAAKRKFLKNVAGSAPAQQRKEASKKRRKYDLDAREPGAAEPTPLLAPGVSLDELRDRLRSKIETRPKKDRKKDNKRPVAVKRPPPRKEPPPPPPKEEASNVEIASVRAPPKRELKKGRVGTPGSKTRRLKALVDKAETRNDELKRLKDEGDDRAHDMQWRQALQTASGELKAPVDPAKLKKALKVREKKKAKSARDWAKRIEHQQELSSLSKKERRQRDAAAAASSDKKKKKKPSQKKTPAQSEETTSETAPKRRRREEN